MNKKYLINTYGCQMNVHESEKIAGTLASLGYEPCDASEDADIIVFNTCCVRENAEQHAFGNIGMLKKIKKDNPDLLIVVCGCMTQQGDFAARLAKTFPYVDIIIGTYNLDKLGQIIERKKETKNQLVDILDKNGELTEETRPLRSSYPNAWVNIIYGCNNFCSYCIVPYVRGRERSRKEADILSEVKGLVEAGYKEITLLGQNVDSYGKDLGDGSDFASLIEDISHIEGKYRLRFMSNHPKDFDEKVVAAIKNNPNACHAVHLPVQSGSDRILSLMNRRYTRQTYIEKIKALKAEIPDCAVTTDIIVGFPTETERDFEDTVSLCEEVGFDGAFTFVYSPREGTRAAAMPEQVDDEVKKDRIMRLVAYQNEKNRIKSSLYVGKTVEVLIEDYDEKKKTYLGRDEYGKMIYAPYGSNIIGQFVSAEVTSAGGMSLFGKIVRTEL